MTKEATQQKIQELQLLEQNLQTYAQQKQNFNAQLLEIESALTELEKTSNAYKIVGNIMVASSKEDLKKELDSKKSLIDVRLKSIDKQETNLKEKFETLQKEILSEMQSDK